MKILSIIPITILLSIVSCDKKTKPQVDSLNNKSILKISSDTNSVKDKSPIQVIGKVYYIDSFLLKPFDLYKFKNKVGRSNSGGTEKKSYRFKPEYEGVYYSFFMFSKLKGYLGSRKEDTLQREDGLTIITFKPFGKWQNDYFDPTEELIEVEAKFNSFYLPELAFVGLNKTDIKEHLGAPSFEINNCFVYTFRDRALILKLNNGKVNWLRYIHLKSELTNDKIFDKLYTE